MHDLESLRYPIGKFKKPTVTTATERAAWIEAIAQLPTQLKVAIADLTAAQLDTPYRPDGWTVRQVVHHIADSHLNAYVRLKLALTEDNPTVKPYFEDRWATLSNSTLPVNVSLQLIDGLHQRWVHLLQQLTDEQWQRTFFHPEHQRAISLNKSTGMYAWHGQHHLAHITNLAAREHWDIKSTEGKR